MSGKALQIFARYYRHQVRPPFDHHILPHKKLSRDRVCGGKL